MTGRQRGAAIGGFGLLCAALWLSPSGAATPPDAPLPALGTELGQFPPGPMKEIADQACLNCHSADIARQQRLTQKQWTAAIDKMVRWGAPLPEDKKDALIAYLVEHFGPDNDRFQPVVASPAP